MPFRLADSLMKTPVRSWFLISSLALGTALLAGCSSNALLAGGATAAALYYEDNVVFQASDEALGQNRFQITVDKTRFIGGRDGELWQIFKRRAADIVKREGCSGYMVLEYTEGIESAIVAGRRVGRGVIECSKAALSKS